MIYLLIIIITIIIIIFIFASPKLSPIPYYPSNNKDLPLIIKALNLKNNQVVYDLGAGDGIVIFEAAKKALNKKLDTVFVAVEINPVLILILHLQRLFHPNKRNIRIVWGDMFKINLKSQNLNLKTKSKILNLGNNVTIEQYSNIAIYLYISPWLIEKTLSIIKKQFAKFDIVSYFYPVKSLKSKETVVCGLKNVYVYKNI